MKVLLIAAEGQVQEALVEYFTLRKRSFDVVGRDWLAAADNLSAATLTIPADIGVVLNTLSLDCLTQPLNESQLLSFVDLAQACERADIPLMLLSSCQVFDGVDGGRHREKDQVSPASIAGAQLSKMEALLAEHCSRPIILRTGPVFSGVGDNLLTALLAQFQLGEPLCLSSSGKSCPVHAQDLARVFSAIIDQLSCGCESWGVYHYCSSDPATYHQFGEAVLAAASQYLPESEQSLLLEPLDTADSNWPSPLLKCGKILNTFGVKQLPWRSFIMPTVKAIFASQAIKEK